MSADTKSSTSPYERLELELPRRQLIDAVADSVNYARLNDEPVKVYRFGFFRLQFVKTRLEEGYSLHVWDKELLHDHDEAPHNHNSYMRSRVLLGRITNQFWSEPVQDPDGIWRPTETICTDTMCEDRPANYRASLAVTEEKSYGPDQPDGDYYVMPRGTIHSSDFDTGTVTLIHKQDIDPNATIVNMLPHEQQPRLQPFDITSFSQELAWGAIEQALQRLRDS